MDRPRHQLLARSALAGDEHGRTRVLQAGDHAQHILNLRVGADDSVGLRLGQKALAQKLVFSRPGQLFPPCAARSSLTLRHGRAW